MNVSRLCVLAGLLSSFAIKGDRFSSDTIPIKKLPGFNKYFVSEKEFSYVDKNEETWTAPTNTVTDGASIPPYCYSIVGQPFDPQFLGAALIHDAYTARANRDGASYHQGTWQRANEVFYEACLKGGTPAWKAKVMYYAVMVGLPDKWVPASDNKGVKKEKQLIRALNVMRVDTTLQKAQLEEVKRFVLAENPSLEMLDSIAVKAADNLKHKQVLRLETSKP